MGGQQPPKSLIQERAHWSLNLLKQGGVGAGKLETDSNMDSRRQARYISLFLDLDPPTPLGSSSPTPRLVLFFVFAAIAEGTMLTSGLDFKLACSFFLCGLVLSSYPYHLEKKKEKK